MPVSGASALGVSVTPPPTAGRAVSCIGRLTTEAPRVSLVDVVGGGCFSGGDIVQADDAIATASQENAWFIFLCTMLPRRRRQNRRSSDLDVGHARRSGERPSFVAYRCNAPDPSYARIGLALIVPDAQLA